jgi:ubiquinone biosynthesis protein
MNFSRLFTIFLKLSFSNKSPSGLRKTFEDLGPTFIKLGQLLSTRPDFVPKEYTEEFRKLLDQNEIIPYPIIKEIIKKELGKDISEVFRSIDQEAIASASIGQVHRAVLKNGNKVVIKILKPGVKECIVEDTKILKTLSGVLQKSSFFKGIGIKKIIEEFSWWINKEIDFQIEADRAKVLAKNLENLDYIIIPIPYENLTTNNLLVIDYINGLTINDLFNTMKAKNVTNPEDLTLPFPIDFGQVISRLIECYIFKQILTDGFFHGDPHPANLILLPDNQIAMVDFGIMGILDKKEHSQVLMTILGIVEDDPKIILNVLTSITEKELNRTDEFDITDVIAEELHKIHGGSLKDANIGELMINIISVGRKYNLRWSPSMVLGMRAIALIEGVCRRLGPKTSIVEFIKPHLRSYLTKDALNKFSEEEVYANLLKFMEFTQGLTNLKDIFGEKGLKVEVNEDKAVRGGDTNG